MTGAVTAIIYNHFRFTHSHMKTLRFMFATVLGDMDRSFRAETLAIGQEHQEATRAIIRSAAARRGLDPGRSNALAEAVTTVMNSEIMMRVAGVGEKLTRQRARRIARYLVAGAVHLNGGDD